MQLQFQQNWIIDNDDDEKGKIERRPGKWYRIYRTWSEWWCWFYRRIDRLRRRACIWLMVTQPPLIRVSLSLLLLPLSEIDLNLCCHKCYAFAERGEREMKGMLYQRSLTLYTSDQRGRRNRQRTATSQTFISLTPFYPNL